MVFSARTSGSTRLRAPAKSPQRIAPDQAYWTLSSASAAEVPLAQAASARSKASNESLIRRMDVPRSWIGPAMLAVGGSGREWAGNGDVAAGEIRGDPAVRQRDVGDKLDPGPATLAQPGHEAGPVCVRGCRGSHLQVVVQRGEVADPAVGNVDVGFQPRRLQLQPDQAPAGQGHQGGEAAAEGAALVVDVARQRGTQ